MCTTAVRLPVNILGKEPVVANLQTISFFHAHMTGVIDVEQTDSQKHELGSSYEHNPRNDPRQNESESAQENKKHSANKTRRKYCRDEENVKGGVKSKN